MKKCSGCGIEKPRDEFSKCKKKMVYNIFVEHVIMLLENKIIIKATKKKKLKEILTIKIIKKK